MHSSTMHELEKTTDFTDEHGWGGSLFENQCNPCNPWLSSGAECSVSISVNAAEWITLAFDADVAADEGGDVDVFTVENSWFKATEPAAAFGLELKLRLGLPYLALCLLLALALQRP